jgi:hypothetical protein
VACAVRDQDLELFATAAREVCERFKVHLEFEEQALKPVFAVLDSWGPERVRELVLEHERQRAELDALMRRLSTEADVEPLALALRGLAAALLRDMDEEEQGCLRASLMSASYLTFERR